jgi:hypothetical protein
LPRRSDGIDAIAGLEDLAQSAARPRGLRHRLLAAAVEPRPVARDVVQQAARLVLLRHEAGEMEQPAPMMARLDDSRLQPQPVAGWLADDLDLLRVEAELVQPAQALLDTEALVRAQLWP